MIARKRLLTVIVGAAAFALLPLVGCSNQPADTKKADETQHEGHAKDEHGKGNHHHEGHNDDHDHDMALTEQDVKLPESFTAGVARLAELHKRIAHLIEHNQLADVHRVAEEMAIVARKMKELAAKDLAEDKRTEAGRLCNEVAGYYKPIDEAADAGKKDETIAIHKQMATSIGKLDSLTK
jgi:ABC-type Zn2+ transport system substrate-binding protein/surface adhesin